MKNETRAVCPVYRDKDGSEFIIAHAEFVGKDHDEAHAIAMGSKLVECVLLGIDFVRVAEIDPSNTPHHRCTMGQYSVALIGGPLFDRLQQEATAGSR